MQLPSQRGPVSAAVLDALAGRRDLDSGAVVAAVRQRCAEVDVVTDDDLQLALWVMYELHYRGFDDVDGRWEWDPELLRVRRELEEPFEAELRRRTEHHVFAATAADGDVPTRLFELTTSFEGPSLAGYLHRDATREQFDEFLVQRSVFHLKESDPQSFVVPRISGKPQTALVELLYDEYGAGRADRLHATMFGDTLEECGLDRSYGVYLDEVPGYTLAVNNAMSLFGLHRRLHAAALGHFGAFEATSSLPSRRLAAGMRRLGLPERAAAYFDEHVEADAVHEQLALRDICGELAGDDPDVLHEVFFGATVCLHLDSVAGTATLEAWQDGRSSLHGAADHGSAVAS